MNAVSSRSISLACAALVVLALLGSSVAAQDKPPPPAILAVKAIRGDGIDQREIGIVLWSVFDGEKVVWYRAGDVREGSAVKDSPPRTSDEPEWSIRGDLERGGEEYSKAVAKEFNEVAPDKLSVKEAKQKLAERYLTFPKIAWQVAERGGEVLAFLENADLIDGGKHQGRLYVFDSLAHLRARLNPSGLTPNRHKNGQKEVRFTSIVEPILKGLAPKSGSGAALLACKDKPFERLLVRWEKPAKDGEPVTRRVLWLPHHSTRVKPDWRIETHLQAFGVKEEIPLSKPEYEAVRATALFTVAPEELDGKNFPGFNRDPKDRVALKSAVELATRTGPDKDKDGTRCWKIGNRYEEEFVTGRTEAEVKGTECAFGAKQYLFGEKATSAFGDIVSGEVVFPVATGGGGATYYPTELTAKPSNEPVVWKLVARPGEPPFYLMDREFTVRQLVAAMVHADDKFRQAARVGQPETWWRSPQGRLVGVAKQIKDWEKEPEKGEVPGVPKNPQAGGGKEAPKGPSPNERVWAGVHRLTDRIGFVFASQKGEWESVAAGWLFDAALAIGDQKSEDLKSATVSRRWLRQREFDSLVAAFEQRAFAWAETGYAAKPQVPSPARLRTDKSETEQERKEREKNEAEKEEKWQAEFAKVFPNDKEWKAFAGYCWDLFGTDYPGGVENFLRGLRRYRATRLVLDKAGKAFPSTAVAPLDDPLTRVSWDAVKPLLFTGNPKAPGLAIRLPTADEWRLAAADVWAGAGKQAAFGWTGDRSRSWPLDALPGKVLKDDTSPDGIRNLIGGVGELVQCEKGIAVMGANYRTDLSANDRLYSPDLAVPFRADIGSEVVGFRFVLVPATEPVEAGAGTVKVFKPAMETWWADKMGLPDSYAHLFGNRTLDGTAPGEAIHRVWHHDRKAVGELVGGHPEWWAAPLRAAVYGYRDESLRDQKPLAEFLAETLKEIYGPHGRK